MGFYTNPAREVTQTNNVIDTKNRVSGVTSPERRLTLNSLARGTDSDDHRTTGSVNRSDTPTGIKTLYLALVLTLHLSRWFARNIQFAEPLHESRNRKRSYAP